MDATVVRRGLGGLTLLLLVTALFAVAFVDNGGSSRYGSRVPFRLIASTTEDAGRARISLTANVGSTFGTVSGQGAFDFTHHVGQMSLTSERFALEERLVGDTVYVKLPTGLAPVSTPWISVDLAAGATGNGLSMLSPSSIVDSLRAVGDVEQVGTDRIRGVATTHYRATSTNGPGGVVDVWTDADGRLRRLEYGAAGAGAAPGTGATAPRVQLEVYDYGVDIGTVDAPPADQVTAVPALFAGSH